MSVEPIKLLLVENDPGLALRMRATLAGANGAPVELHYVARLAQAQDSLLAASFDVIVLDPSLPDGYGLDTLTHLQELVPDVPIVVLISRTEESLAVAAMREGAQDYLVKGQIRADLLGRVLRNAIERHRLRQELRSLSLTDSLTGLYNRRGFSTLADQQVKLARRLGWGLFLVFVDVDRLKHINDSYGHAEGDAALIQFSEILRRTFRASDIVARLGGDEFVALVVGARADSVPILEARLQFALQEHNTLAGRPYRLSVSAGVTRIGPQGTSTVDELLARADAQMYAHKQVTSDGRAAYRGEGRPPAGIRPAATPEADGLHPRQ